jgi:Domain of unknown function (DUF4340)
VKARARTALSSLVLLGLAGGALVWGWLGVERKGEAEQAAKEREEKVFRFAAADVREVLVAAKGGETRLVRAGEAWRIASPVEAEADRFVAGTLVERLASLRRTREVAPAPGGDLAQYGLAAPRVRLEAQLADGRRETLALGDESAFDRSLFVRATSGAVLAVPGDVRYALERDAFDLREKRVLRFDPARAAAISVSGPAGRYELRRSGEQDTWILSPGGAPADPARVSALLGALESLRASGFPPAATGRGLEKPVRTVVVADASGTELARLEVGATAGESTSVRAAPGPPVATVAASALQAIPATGAELAQKLPEAPGAPAEKRVDPRPTSP